MVKKLVASCLLGASLLMPLNGHARLTEKDCITFGLTMAYCIWGKGSPSEKASVVYQAGLKSVGLQFAESSAHFCLFLAQKVQKGKFNEALDSLSYFIQTCINKSRAF